MTSISETLFDTYGDSLMQEYAPYDEAEILAAISEEALVSIPIITLGL